VRVVIDTSSLVSYALTAGPLMRKVVAAWRAGEIVLVTSPATRAELEAVLKRPRIRSMAVLPLDALTLGLERFSFHVPGRLRLSGICRDPKDDIFLACAAEGETSYLVTSDHDLLVLRRYEEVAIVNPGQLLLALELRSVEAESIALRFDAETLLAIRATTPLDPLSANRLEAALTILRDRDASLD
jgi:putative PIN family toxin of toxin-antitoxin system